jgi:hypothetical protein
MVGGGFSGDTPYNKTDKRAQTLARVRAVRKNNKKKRNFGITMKKLGLFFLFGLLWLVWTACKKSSVPSTAEPTYTPGWDVYFAGQDSGQAVYWKNGLRTVLDPAGLAQGIAVSGSDVYVGGGVFKGNLAALWKNGVEEDLTDTTAWAYTPVLSGADVYVPGYIGSWGGQPKAVYWKNGQPVILDSTEWAIATGMAVNESDVYVLGFVGGSVVDSSVVWKNDQVLAGANSTFDQPYNQILVSGGNIYVAGSRVDSAGNVWAAYWKNGVMDTLANYPGTTISDARSIVIAGSDVYVAGVAVVNGVSWAVFWKNSAEAAPSRNGAIFGAAVVN